MPEWLSTLPMNVFTFNGSTVTLLVGLARDGRTVQVAMRVDGETPVWLPPRKLKDLVAKLRQVGAEIGEDV